MTIKEEGVAVDLIAEGTTDLGIEFAEREFKMSEGYIAYDADGKDGKIVIMLGSVPNPPEERISARLIRYTTQNPLGRTIFSERSLYQLTVEFL